LYKPEVLVCKQLLVEPFLVCIVELPWLMAPLICKQETLWEDKFKS
jgi:hypothetical protein